MSDKCAYFDFSIVNGMFCLGAVDESPNKIMAKKINNFMESGKAFRLHVVEIEEIDS